MKHTQENNSRKSSWKYLERAPLCFQVAFSLPTWWTLFQMIHPEIRTFNFSFTLDEATRNQGSSGSFTLKHLKGIKSSAISPTALSWFIQQTQTSSQSSQWWNEAEFMEEYNLPLRMKEQTKGVLCYPQQPSMPRLWPPLRPLPTTPNAARLSKAWDPGAVTSSTCCCLTWGTGTLLTPVHAGTSAKEASSPWSTAEDHFWGGKEMYASSCFP